MHRPATDSTPRFSLADGQRICREFFGITGSAAALPSERDQNFAITAAGGGKFVLKIANSGEARSALDMQNAALEHLAVRAPALALPRLIRAPGGAATVTVRSAGDVEYFARLLSFLEGMIYVHALSHPVPLLASLGEVLGELDRALESFSHPGLHRVLYWDLKHADLALAHLELLARDERAVVEECMEAWAGVRWQPLRHGAIHGDVNDYNVLVRAGRVVGVLDFGDMVHSATVCDLAIALAYALLDATDPLACAAPIIRAYHAHCPLTEAEIAVLYSLMRTRLCMSLCYAAYNARVKEGDAYQLVSAEPAGRLLRHLASIPRAAAERAFRDVCERP